MSVYRTIGPLVSHLYPFFFCLFAPQKLHFALTHHQILHFFHCGDKMIKVNIFSMAFSKTYCLFHFQTNFFFVFIFFHINNIWPPKKCNLHANILRTFPMEFKYTENIKEIINGINYRFS